MTITARKSEQKLAPGSVILFRDKYQDDKARIGFRIEARIAQEELRDTSRMENVSLQDRRWVMDANGSRPDAVFRMMWKSFQG